MCMSSYRHFRCARCVVSNPTQPKTVNVPTYPSSQPPFPPGSDYPPLVPSNALHPPTHQPPQVTLHKTPAHNTPIQTPPNAQSDLTFQTHTAPQTAILQERGRGSIIICFQILSKQKNIIDIYINSDGYGDISHYPAFLSTFQFHPI